MSTLHVDIAIVGEATIVSIVGDGAASNVMALESAVTRLSAMRPHAVVLDLSRLSFIASLCMGCLVALRRSAVAHHGTVRIAAANEQVGTALRRAKLNAIFPLDPTVKDALAAIAEPRDAKEDARA